MTQETTGMEFSFFLSAFMPDAAYGAKRLYADLVEQAVTAERLGYGAVAIPEHHLINILMVPSPLQMAVKIASVTRRLKLITSVVVLPIRDMRILAGEIAQAHMLTDERLVVGVGRGAFPWETGQLGTPLEATREKFDESLAVLEALLEREEVVWDGKYYKFGPITAMPRPSSPIPIMIASVSPEGIYHAARRGYHVQTTPLSGAHDVLVKQVEAFRRGKEEAGAAGKHIRLSLQRGIYAAKDAADARDKVALANEYYKRFDNIKGPGVVKGGMIEPLPRRQSLEELASNLLIGAPQHLVDQLAIYAELGIDEVFCPCGYGQSQGETLEMMHRFAAEVMPHFRSGLRALG
jgi:alkanesulfonate monooxygenase SsuD/methylene tetrahydromethanopterin reductase-like flavin-dependent oxidoreductase (luciferase family)